MKKVLDKIKVAWAIVRGDEEGIAKLVLQWINSLLAKLPGERTAGVADAVAGVAEAVGRIAALITRHAVSRAIAATSAAVRTVAESIRDRELTAEEGSAIDLAIRDAVAAWKDC